VTLISNITRHSKKLKEQKDQENKGDSSNVTHITDGSQRGKGSMQTKVSLARKVSSKKTTILATSGSAGQVTGYNSVANATRALDHFTTAADEVINQRRTSAYQLGKVPARKIKTKNAK